MKSFLHFVPIILFFVTFKYFDDPQEGILAATAVLMVALTIQTAVTWVLEKRLDKMSLGMAVVALVLGGVTLLLNDGIYIKWKASVVNWILGIAFLGSAFIGKKNFTERMLGHAVKLPATSWRNLNLSWTIFFLFVGCLNLYIAYNFSTDVWVDFKLFGIMGLTFLFVIVQAVYVAMRGESIAEPASPEK